MSPGGVMGGEARNGTGIWLIPSKTPHSFRIFLDAFFSFTDQHSLFYAPNFPTVQKTPKPIQKQVKTQKHNDLSVFPDQPSSPPCFFSPPPPYIEGVSTSRQVAHQFVTRTI